MLKISQQVMDRFEAEASLRAVCWHQERLLARFPELLASPTAAQHDFAKRNRLSAIALNIEQEEDIATFLDCAVMYGEKFMQEPWAREILDEPGISGEGRAELLRQALVEIGISL